MGGFADTSDFSEKKLGELRSQLQTIVPTHDLVVTCGSYARREAVADSDLDFFSVAKGETNDSVPAWFNKVEGIVKAVVGKLPARGGAFSKVVSEDELLSNFGGVKDNNDCITRRMLYLLEGEFLTNEEKFKSIRLVIIDKYVRNTPEDHQLAFYLLNDVIRYWRTLAVDYADKTYGAERTKPWAIRNVKLVFSRKLIYASGLFSIALTADRRVQAKIEILEKLFAMTPIDRIKYVCGESQSQRLFEMYNFFLDKMSNHNVREHLESLRLENKSSDDTFRQIKNEGHYFSRELMGLFHRTFHSSHPIHMAVIF